jgi:hypothetical protein
MQRSSFSASVLLLVSINRQPERSQDYPQWRGKTRDGSASAFTTAGVILNTHAPVEG